jgi:hypothetical protein
MFVEHKWICCKWIIFADSMVVSESEKGERVFGLEMNQGEGLLCVVIEGDHVRERSGKKKKKKNILKNNI